MPERLVARARRHLRPLGRQGRRALFEAANVRYRGTAAPIETVRARPVASDAERYWSEHTVVQPPLHSRRRALEYFAWLRRSYPLIEELMNYGAAPPGRVLDYGCGTGDGISRFLLQGAEHVTGVDVSRKALAIAANRLALHGFARDRIRLIEIDDADGVVPAADGSFDYVHCNGVIQHTTDPQRVLEELARLAAVGATGRIMVYNRDSAWYHLYVPYVLQILECVDRELSTDEAFRRSTDGADCPISRAFRPPDFVAMAAAAGLRLEYLGAFCTPEDIGPLRHLQAARRDERLAGEHRAFLEQIEVRDGLPHFEGRAAGIGSTFAVLPR